MSLVPENLFYTKEHEWIKQEGKVLVIGITDFAQGELGDIVYVELDTEGELLEQGETFGSVEAVKTVSDLFMPVTGEVIAVNEQLEDNPELVNEDPYGKGWMVKIAPTQPEDIQGLLSAEEYQDLVG